MKKRYLSQVISEEQAKQVFTKKGTIQVINSCTGSGKSTLIMNNILDIAKEDWKLFEKEEWDNKRILLLANRSALVSKLRKELKDELIKSVFDSSAELIFTHKYFDIYSYQTATKFIADNPDFLKQYSVVICDEIHYAISDSKFNFSTNLMLKSLVDHSQDNTVLFSTATDKEIKLALVALSHKFFDSKPLFEEVLTKEQSNKLGYKDRLHINVTNEDLDTIINSIPTDEKILIFVKDNFSKKDMEKLALTYGDTERQIGVVYSKWEKGYRNSVKEIEDMAERLDLMINKQRFYDDDIDVLIANQSIDNGINFIDNDLKHIILLEHYNMTQTIQKIGRKRFDKDNPNDTTTVYHTLPNRKTVESKVKTSKAIRTKNLEYQHQGTEYFIKKYPMELHFNSVYVKEEVENESELYNIAVRNMYIMESMGHKFNNDFPFIKAYNAGKEYVFPNYCQIVFHIDQYVEMDTYLEQYIKPKEVFKSDYFEKKYKDLGYENVTYRGKKITRKKVMENMGERFPLHLDSLVGKEMTSKEYTSERKYCKKQWQIQTENRNPLNAKEFEKFINEYGYGINFKRKTVDGKKISIFTIIKL